MPPLKIELLLRLYYSGAPNADLPEVQAFAPSMHMALADFRKQGLVAPETTLADLRCGKPSRMLTDKGHALVQAICAVELDAVPPGLRDEFAMAARPAPPMPKIKPPRPDYETMLRDEWIGRAMTGAMSRGWRNPKDVVSEVIAAVDAMLGARNANR